MAIYYRMRRRRRGRFLFFLVSGSVLAVCLWWTFFRGEAPLPAKGKVAVLPRPALTNQRPEVDPPRVPSPEVAEKGDTPKPKNSEKPSGPVGQQAGALVTVGKQALQRGDILAARTHLSEAVRMGIDEPQRSLVRAELTRIGNDTILSPKIVKDDPLVARYIIKPGDTLGKVAKAHNVSADLLASINGIVDKNRIRAGQTIKVVTGPFHAVVNKGEFVLEVYLRDTFVTHFKVGLGADDGTPTGEWKIGTKLVNPTYYPPRGGTIIAADDPNNPLGERWIGLVGVSGEAAGQERYGIHGTIEPDSVGKNVSLGCIRMYNEDVAALYTYLVEKQSTVTVRD